ncbi:hypothetical protein [Enterobacter asburiae]|uniref:hypothetical protein n=1 Tax=Enterobacter asburiae TaxID=61645 RepID=UPI00192B88FC|nr:hypothetical protein [Enterobacter asburiae]MBL5911213.1 hypothetical protein [Enterobacter asburiae]
MHRIDTPTAQTDKFGRGKNGFTNGDPSTGRRATDLNSDMWDAVQEEICTVIERAGIALDKAQHDQLYEAIVGLITDSVPDALLRKNNLSDVIDKAVARQNLELKNAAQRDVQESRDDITPGRVLVNGGALALRTVAAKAGTPIADASALPANSVSFCYSDAAFSPGYEATILDVGGLDGAGYRVQYAASYADGGKRLKFRTLNADNGFWGGWTSVLTNYGGTVSHLDGATYYQANPAVWMGAGAFQTQYGSYAPFHLPFGHEVPQGVSQYLPLIKGVTSTAGYGFGAAVSFGILRSGSNDFGSAVIHILGDSGTGAIYQFGHDGTFYAPGQVSNGGSIFAGQGVFESGGLVRVYSSNNPPPQQDLSPYATQAWVAANFLQAGQRLASLGVATNSNNDNEFAYAPNGAVVTAVQQKTNYTAVQYRYVQYNINGNWYTAWVA